MKTKMKLGFICISISLVIIVSSASVIALYRPIYMVDRSADTIIKFIHPFEEFSIINRENKTIPILEIHLKFSPYHREKNFFGFEEKINEPYQGRITNLFIQFSVDVEVHNTSNDSGKISVFYVDLMNSSHRTEEYLTNTSQLAFSYYKEQSNSTNGWRSSEGWLAIRLNLYKLNFSVNIEDTYRINLFCMMGETITTQYQFQNNVTAPG